MTMMNLRCLSTIYTIAYANLLAAQSVSAFSSQVVTSLRQFGTRSGASTLKIMAVQDQDAVNPLTQRGLPSPLLLGSASFTRKLILSEMKIPYHKVVRPIDEKALGDRSKDTPHDLVLNLGMAKMNHLVNEIQSGNCADDMPTTNEESWIVLTGDQVVTHNGNILEKPESIEQAKQFVEGYATSPCSTVGSCVLTHLPTRIQVSGVDTATIHFKSTINSELVDRMLAEEAPILSCAGGLMIEHPLVREHIEKIDGTEDSVMGLSKDLVERLLEELKMKLESHY